MLCTAVRCSSTGHHIPCAEHYTLCWYQKSHSAPYQYQARSARTVPDIASQAIPVPDIQHDPLGQYRTSHSTCVGWYLELWREEHGYCALAPFDRFQIQTSIDDLSTAV
eukprot:2258993-Rhodomonas_salina.3